MLIYRRSDQLEIVGHTDCDFARCQEYKIHFELLAYMAVNVDFDDNKSHVLDKQRITLYAFKTRN